MMLKDKICEFGKVLKDHKIKCGLFLLASTIISFLYIYQTYDWVRISSTISTRDTIFADKLMALAKDSKPSAVKRFINTDPSLDALSHMETCLLTKVKTKWEEGHKRAFNYYFDGKDQQAGTITLSILGPPEKKALFIKTLKSCITQIKLKTQKYRQKWIDVFQAILAQRKITSQSPLFSKESILSQNNFLEETIIIKELSHYYQSSGNIKAELITFSTESYLTFSQILSVLCKLILFNLIALYSLYFFYLKL